MRSLAVSLLMLSVLVGPVAADDLAPPPWRGQPGSSWAEWDFLTPDSPVPPDAGSWPYGIPSAQPIAGFGQYYLSQWGGRLGVWPLSGEIWIDMPNRPEPNEYKDIWVQLTWAQQVTNVEPIVYFMLNRQQAGMTVMPETARQVIGQTNDPGGDGNWYHSVYYLRWFPNVPFEVIAVTGAVNVDQVVVDTICAPEPMSAGLLTLGCVALSVRRRRAR